MEWLSTLKITVIRRRIEEKNSVLVSARTELIFFLVPGIVLCFGFSRKIMLITH